jgi:hypothetical protein
MHAWLVNQDARDWLDQERSIDMLARTEGSKFPGGDLTVHHIFSRKILADAGLADSANRAANFALLSRSTNAEFGDKGSRRGLEDADARPAKPGAPAAFWRRVLALTLFRNPSDRSARILPFTK